MDPEKKRITENRLANVFRPAAPITDTDIFSGRKEQIRRALEALNTPSTHLIVFGERGLGKTSFANYLSKYLTVGEEDVPVIVPHINCTNNDSFSSIWKRVFEKIIIMANKSSIGFNVEPEEIKKRLIDDLPEELDLNAVWSILEWIPGICSKFFLIIDEFDRIKSPELRQSIADTIKHLADREIDVKIIIVGVSKSVSDLISEHQSIARSLKEIYMPRMLKAEIIEFLEKGFKACNFSISEKTLNEIAIISSGLPHYAHRLGLSIGRVALDRDSLAIEDHDVLPALKRTIEDSEQTLKDTKRKAIHCRHSDNYYQQALLACSLAPTDDMGFFTAAAVKKPMNSIEGRIGARKTYEIPNYIRHLQEFCREKRGPVLITEGGSHDKRYRFANAHIQPIILMDGIESGMIDFNLLVKYIHKTQPN